MGTDLMISHYIYTGVDKSDKTSFIRCTQKDASTTAAKEQQKGSPCKSRQKAMPTISHSSFIFFRFLQKYCTKRYCTGILSLYQKMSCTKILYQD